MNKTTAFVFPGQGAQFVGMGRDVFDQYPIAKTAFQTADEVLDFPLSRLIFEGPEEELRLTKNAQPALVAVAYALLAVARESVVSLPTPRFVAGHSLGEYTALAAAGVVCFADSVYLARERGRLMYEAGLARPGTMAAIIGMDEAPLAQVCRETGVWIANINSPGQIVISGEIDNINNAAILAKERGAVKAITLQVSGAFHTPLMEPAVAGMETAIAKTSFSVPICPVVGNTTAHPLTTADQIQKELIDQLCNCIRWQQSVTYMIGEGIDTHYEFGPGKVLAGLARRIDKQISTVNIGDAVGIQGLVSGA
ncbi:ACP S-malonyltransferase [Chloroflexota bacterium]